MYTSKKLDSIMLNIYNLKTIKLSIMVTLDPLSMFLYRLNTMHNNGRWIYKYNKESIAMQVNLNCCTYFGFKIVNKAESTPINIWKMAKFLQ